MKDGMYNERELKVMFGVRTLKEVIEIAGKMGKRIVPMDDVASADMKRAAKKAGRNEPCPCGSGKKYKKCCGR